MIRMADAEVELPPTDDDRRRVIDQIRAAGGQLGLDECERRMSIAVQAPSKAELALLVWDLGTTPAQPADLPAPEIGAWKSLSFRLHATTYALTNAMLVGIWDLTDSHGLFWPFFPIAGWGIGLASHAVSTRAIQKRTYEKQLRNLEAKSRGDRPKARRHRPIDVRTPQLPPGRTQVVVMFTDVVDSTRLTAVIGDEDWTRLRARYRAVLTDCYAQHRGREVNSAGDGFLARFESPTDAVRCGVEIQRRLQAQREDTGFAPSVRIGINAGPAVEENGDVLGTTVNLAARVTATADPNQVLITERVADHLDDRFRLSDQGLRQMKGMDRSVHVISVEWRR